MEVIEVSLQLFEYRESRIGPYTPKPPHTWVDQASGNA
jgi:hypothetical protein